jgi:hypothetical protein
MGGSRGGAGRAMVESAFRFYLLYDKIYRDDILLHAYALGHPAGLIEYTQQHP